MLLRSIHFPPINPTSSEVASVLEASAAATSLPRSATTAKLVFASASSTALSTALFRRRAPLVGLFLGRQSRLAFLFVLLQELGSIIFLQLGVDDLIEALALLGQREEACNGTETIRDSIRETAPRIASVQVCDGL